MSGNETLPESHKNEINGCSLNNQFGIVVQAILAFTAFCVLIRNLYCFGSEHGFVVKVYSTQL